MHKASMVLSVLLLTACSSKPEVSELKPMIVQGWEGCPWVTPTNFKKLNGFEDKRGYLLRVSYDVKFNHDMVDPIPGFVQSAECTRVLRQLMQATKGASMYLAKKG